MLQAFIVTLREGVEAALIVGLTLAYLSKIGRADLRKAVYAGLGGCLCRQHWAGDSARSHPLERRHL